MGLDIHKTNSNSVTFHRSNQNMWNFSLWFDENTYWNERALMKYQNTCTVTELSFQWNWYYLDWSWEFSNFVSRYNSNNAVMKNLFLRSHLSF